MARPSLSLLLSQSQLLGANTLKKESKIKLVQPVPQIGQSQLSKSKFVSDIN